MEVSKYGYRGILVGKYRGRKVRKDGMSRRGRLFGVSWHWILYGFPRASSVGRVSIVSCVRVVP